MILDYFSNFFYDPWTFWGVPLVFALAWEGYRGLGGGCDSDPLEPTAKFGAGGDLRLERLKIG